MNTDKFKKPSLRLRIIVVLLTVSLLPLLLVGIGSWIVLGGLLDKKSLEHQQAIVANHAYAIESTLNSRMNDLRLLAETHDFAEMSRSDNLKHQFYSLNEVSDGGFIDLGLINSEGKHIAYVGPYDLLDKNYKNSDWFKQVSLESEYISDVFLGYRNLPHCIIAVKCNGENPWFLRATINSEQFDALVKTGVLGLSGESFIINREGLYQTSPKKGAVLEDSGLKDIPVFNGLLSEKVLVDGSQKVRVSTWINRRQWLLVVQQDEAEVRAPVNRAFLSGALIVGLAVALTVITTILATWHLTRKIDRANAKREEMFRAFLRSAKLASVGELATGLAHEINNPLAIMSADQTNISDLANSLPQDDAAKDEILVSVERCKKQIKRCKNITTKMLQFGRKRETELELTELEPHLRDIASLLSRQAGVRNVTLELEIEDNLPEVMIDPVELEQVMVNLINNSIFAMPEGGIIRISAALIGEEVLLTVEDEGCGIPPEALDRIFEPFFTTKPVDKGTGLGLSVCYGIVQSWGGRVDVTSEVGKGTKIYIYIPVTQ